MNELPFSWISNPSSEEFFLPEEIEYAPVVLRAKISGGNEACVLMICRRNSYLPNGDIEEVQTLKILIPVAHLAETQMHALRTGQEADAMSRIINAGNN